jgi:hypothetical protein
MRGRAQIRKCLIALAVVLAAAPAGSVGGAGPDPVELERARPPMQRALEPALVGTSASGSGRDATQAPPHAVDPVDWGQAWQGASVPIPPPPEVFVGAPAPAGAPPPQLSGTARAAGAPSGDGVWAVIIGIDDYPGYQADLHYAVADAEALDTALARFGVPSERRLVLRDGQARREAVLDALGWLLQRAGPDSTAVVFFAGHVRYLGGGSHAMLTAEGAELTDTELEDRLDALAARHTWIVVAACYGAGFDELLAPGRVLTGAADSRSLAYENHEIGGSYLVHYMVREGWLHGRAGPSVQDAFRFADETLAASRPYHRPVQIDHAGAPVTFGPMPAQPSQPEPAQDHGPRPVSHPASQPADEPAAQDPPPGSGGSEQRDPPGMRRPSCLVCLNAGRLTALSW